MAIGEACGVHLGREHLYGIQQCLDPGTEGRCLLDHVPQDPPRGVSVLLDQRAIHEAPPANLPPQGLVRVKVDGGVG